MIKLSCLRQEYLVKFIIMDYFSCLCKSLFKIHCDHKTISVCNETNTCMCHTFMHMPYHFLAHLSQRLIGELIGYPWSGVRRRPSSSSVRPQFSNVFFSETARPIKAKFYVEPSWEGGTKVYINGLGHMTKMAAMPIYGKNLKKSSSPEPDVL